MVNAQHSSKHVEHYTPIDVITAARSLMGGIDLDPASCADANSYIEATRFISKEENGLACQWSGSVWLNPPGGRGQAKKWFQKLESEYFSGRVTEALFLGFNLEIVQTCQSVLDFPFCIPAKRLEFYTVVDGTFKAGESPTHANIIVWLPPASHGGNFEVLFSHIGKVRM